MTQMNHYFYDHQGAIVDQLLQTERKIQKGDFIMFTTEEPAVYQIQGVLHIQGERINNTCNWVINRVTKLIVNMSHIDTTAPRAPLPLKSVQAFRES